MFLGVEYPNIPLFINPQDGPMLVRLYNLTHEYIYAETRVLFRVLENPYYFGVTIVLNEQGAYRFENKKGTTGNRIKFYTDGTFLYLWAALWNLGTISFVGGSTMNKDTLGGIIMTSADVSGMTELLLP